MIEARAVQVASGKTRNGCVTDVWIEFQPPGSREKYTYLGAFYFLGRSTPLGFLDDDDPECTGVDWRVGDTVEMAYVPSNPKINRTYWGKLARGGEQVEWMIYVTLAGSFGLGAAWLYWMRRRP